MSNTPHTDTRPSSALALAVRDIRDAFMKDGDVAAAITKAENVIADERRIAR